MTKIGIGRRVLAREVPQRCTPSKGSAVTVNDLHIAAHARSEGLVLVTNNTREFERVPALQVENWLN